MFIFYLISCAVLGLCLGSFTNALVWRTARGLSVAAGRSQCVHCARQLSWRENIPLLSYVWLRGRCASCQGAIPRHYPLVELAGALGFTLIAAGHWNGGVFEIVALAGDLVFFSVGLIIFVSDVLHQLIFPSVVWIGTAGGLVLNYFYFHVSFFSMALGAVVAGGFFALQYVLSQGRWIGGGDVRLGVMMGVWLGWPAVLVALFFAYISGAVVGVALLAVRRKQMGSMIAFGTFLILATLATHWWGSALIEWYWSLVSGGY